MLVAAARSRIGFEKESFFSLHLRTVESTISYSYFLMGFGCKVWGYQSIFVNPKARSTNTYTDRAFLLNKTLSAFINDNPKIPKSSAKHN